MVLPTSATEINMGWCTVSVTCYHNEFSGVFGSKTYCSTDSGLRLTIVSSFTATHIRTVRTTDHGRIIKATVSSILVGLYFGLKVQYVRQFSFCTIQEIPPPLCACCSREIARHLRRKSAENYSLNCCVRCIYLNSQQLGRALCPLSAMEII